MINSGCFTHSLGGICHIHQAPAQLTIQKQYLKLQTPFAPSKEQMNHSSTTEQLKLENYAAMQLWEDWLGQLPGVEFLSLPWVALQSRGCFPTLCCSIQFVLNSVWLTSVGSWGCQFPWCALALALALKVTWNLFSEGPRWRKWNLVSFKHHNYTKWYNLRTCHI
jgi:hypothetical protein